MILLLATAALGFEPTDRSWGVGGMPIEYCVGPCPMEVPDCEARVEWAFRRWNAIDDRVSGVSRGACENDALADDDVNQVIFTDPGPDPLSRFTITRGTPCDTLKEYDVHVGGSPFADPPFYTDVQVEDGDCTAGWNLDQILLYKIGRMLGLSTSLVVDAAMSATWESSCKPSRGLHDDDAEALAYQFSTCLGDDSPQTGNPLPQDPDGGPGNCSCASADRGGFAWLVTALVGRRR